VSQPYDLADQDMARWLYFWWRRYHDWNRVLFRARERFPGEDDSRILSVWERTMAAVTRMPRPYSWKPSPKE
jgi:hypothetical protein